MGGWGLGLLGWGWLGGTEGSGAAFPRQQGFSGLDGW